MNLAVLFSILGGVMMLAIMGATFLMSFRNGTTKATIDNQNTLIETYRARETQLEHQLKQLGDQQLENAKAIADLQGQIKTLKEIPLQEIAAGLKINSEKLDAILKERRIKFEKREKGI